MFMVHTEGFCSNSLIPKDLSGAMRDSFVLPDHLPHVKRVRVSGVFSSHQSKRAPHLLQADAVASVKRMRSAEPLPLSAFLPSLVHTDNAEIVPSSASLTLVQLPSSTITMAVRTAQNRSPPGVAQG